jgi:formylglycine-generating enzyme required for sulfatase activity
MKISNMLPISFSLLIMSSNMFAESMESVLARSNEKFKKAAEAQKMIAQQPPPPKTARLVQLLNGDQGAVSDFDIKWISISGGPYLIKTRSFQKGAIVSGVTMKSFEMSQAPVTVWQYAECVKAKKCSAPETDDGCNWGIAGRELHPVNCVSFDQARDFARFKNARLPTIYEWQYAASGGKPGLLYPWGSDAPTCENAVMTGCSQTTMPVCSKPAGNTSTGLCDMLGNVAQWVTNAPEILFAYEGERVSYDPSRSSGNQQYHHLAGSGYHYLVHDMTERRDILIATIDDTNVGGDEVRPTVGIRLVKQKK